MLLLTGATGFIGTHLSQELGFKSISYRKVIRGIKNLNNVDAFYIDYLNGYTNWSGAFDGIKSIIHLAGLAHNAKNNTQEFYQVNVDGTLNLARQAVKSGVKRFVFVSSIGVNGNSTFNEPYTVSSAVNPHNSYAKSKLAAEVGLSKIASETGLEVVIVRPTMVYGPNAPGNFGKLTKMVKILPALPFGLAVNKRDFISVQNLADLLIVCATHPKAAGHTFLASESETVSTKEFTNAIVEGLGKKIVQLPIPVSLFRLASKFIVNSAMVDQLFGNLQVDSSNLKDVLGWTPPLTLKQSMALLQN